MKLIRIFDREFRFVENDIESAHHHLAMAYLRPCGIEQVVRHVGENNDSYAQRIYARLHENPDFYELMGCLILPSELPESEWSPQIGMETGRFIRELSDVSSKAKFRRQAVDAVIDFYMLRPDYLSETTAAQQMSLATVQPAAMIPVHARPHPFSMEIVHAEFPVGLTVAEILGPEAKACAVEIGGMTIPEEWWPRIRPKPGHAVVITRYPQGGSAKSIFRIVAFAALAIGVVLTAGSTAPIFTTLGGIIGTTGATAAGLAAAGLGIVGSLLINALIPPSTPAGVGATDNGTNLLKAITGTSNQINRWRAVGVRITRIV